MPSRSRSRSMVILILVVAVGLAWRFAPLGLPRFAWKYGGSALWAAAVYWSIAFAWPRMRASRLALCAASIAVIVEWSRLWRVAWLDAFRETLAGKLLLGKYFSLRNVVAYFVGIAICLLADWACNRQTSKRQ